MYYEKPLFDSFSEVSRIICKTTVVRFTGSVEKVHYKYWGEFVAGGSPDT